MFPLKSVVVNSVYESWHTLSHLFTADYKSIIQVIVGTNGSGKSTILKLITRIYDPIEGEILVDGKNIKTLKLNDLRNAISVLFQDFSRLPHPNPSPARMDNIIGLKTNATSTQFNDNTCDISSILSNWETSVSVLCMCAPVNGRTSIPQCCLPWNSERPSSRNCWTIFSERRGKPAGT